MSEVAMCDSFEVTADVRTGNSSSAPLHTTAYAAAAREAADRLDAALNGAREQLSSVQRLSRKISFREVGDDESRIPARNQARGWDWALAFGEDTRKRGSCRGTRAARKQELTLPQDWPPQGFTVDPAAREVKDWGETEWKKHKAWETTPWKNRLERVLGNSVTMPVDASDRFAAMLDTYMNTPAQCPVHTLKLGFMKAGLEVEERMSEHYDVLFLLVRCEDEVMKKAVKDLTHADLLDVKRSLIQKVLHRPDDEEMAKELICTLSSEDRETIEPELNALQHIRARYTVYIERDDSTELKRLPTDKLESPKKGAVKLGRSTFIPADQWHTHFENQSLLAKLDWKWHSVFHSGERQQIVRAIMESVEWARDGPDTSYGPDTRFPWSRRTQERFKVMTFLQEDKIKVTKAIRELENPDDAKKAAATLQSLSAKLPWFQATCDVDDDNIEDQSGDVDEKQSCRLSLFCVDGRERVSQSDSTNFLVDCFPLHCEEEHRFLNRTFSQAGADQRAANEAGMCSGAASCWKSYKHDTKSFLSSFVIPCGKHAMADVLHLPLEHVQGYYGSEVGIYFAWMSWYTKYLVYPAVFGLLLQTAVWSQGGLKASMDILGGWLWAFCVFMALWSSAFLVTWQQKQFDLQHRWGLHDLGRRAQPRPGFKGKREVGLLGDHTEAHESPVRHSCSTFWRTATFVVLGAAIVTICSLFLVMVRVTGKNLQDGMASSWTTLKFTDDTQFDTTGNVSDVSAEFWTIYDSSCYSLSWDGCLHRNGHRPGDEATAYSFPHAAHEDEDGSLQRRKQYTWRTSEQTLLYRTPKVVDWKAKLLQNAEFRDVMLPACAPQQSSREGVRRVCCAADDFDRPDNAVPCWSQAKQDIADAAAELTVVSIDSPTLETRATIGPTVHFQTPAGTAVALPYGVIAPWDWGGNGAPDQFSAAKAASQCEPLHAGDEGSQPNTVCRFTTKSKLEKFVQASQNTGLIDILAVLSSAQPPAVLPRRVPLNQPDCHVLEDYIREAREELMAAGIDRSIEIKTVESSHGRSIAAGSDQQGGIGTWVSYRPVYPFVQASAHLFRYRLLNATDIETSDPWEASANATRCEVHGSLTLLPQCNLDADTRTTCEAIGGTWSEGIFSTEEQIGDGAVRTALYHRKAETSFTILRSSWRVWGSSLCSVLLMMVFARCWVGLSKWLNDTENHRTYIDYERNFIVKQCAFQFINYYLMLFYVAYMKVGTLNLFGLGYVAARFEAPWYLPAFLTGNFELLTDIQRRVVGQQMEDTPIVELRDVCVDSVEAQNDCTTELMQQLLVIFSVKQFIQQLFESNWPTCKANCCRRCFRRSSPYHWLEGPDSEDPSGVSASDSEDPSDMSAVSVYRQYEKPKWGDGSIGGSVGDFNEMVIQYGFVTLFAVAFPAAAFFALLNNIQEIRADAAKLMDGHQRPPIVQREDIGAWQPVLSFMDYAAVVTNACILGFTSGIFDDMIDSDQLSSLGERFTKYELWVMVAAHEHVLFLIKIALAWRYAGESDEQKQARQDHRQAETNLKLEQARAEAAAKADLERAKARADQERAEARADQERAEKEKALAEKAMEQERADSSEFAEQAFDKILEASRKGESEEEKAEALKKEIEKQRHESGARLLCKTTQELRRIGSTVLSPDAKYLAAEERAEQERQLEARRLEDVRLEQSNLMRLTPEVARTIIGKVDAVVVIGHAELRGTLVHVADDDRADGKVEVKVDFLGGLTEDGDESRSRTEAAQAKWPGKSFGRWAKGGNNGRKVGLRCDELAMAQESVNGE